MAKNSIINDTEFSQNLDSIRQEVLIAIESFYTYVEIHNQLALNEGLYHKLNQNPSFWNITLHSLQNTLFITLGRIFDDSPEAHSVHKLVATCLANSHLFSKESLAKRKMKDGERPQWLDDYLLDAFEPSTHDLRVFKKEVSRLRKIFDPVYKDIRNKVVAHSQFNDLKLISQLFSKTQIGEINKLLYGLYDVLIVLWELLHNGRKPEFGTQSYDYKERISKTTEDVLNAFH